MSLVADVFHVLCRSDEYYNKISLEHGPVYSYYAASVFSLNKPSRDEVSERTAKSRAFLP